ncbi:hypothetical protein CEXT_362691 [Caerostris extrusa]|uniref:Uncharacterized protein n=1 Tax=Caerostris extrusa TaxID=172846 RepID=A0AAV4XEC0_CAEEX|nr:hypothetical protein CEXT_362691 [Caerostris extrusa]
MQNLNHLEEFIPWKKPHRGAVKAPRIADRKGEYYVLRRESFLSEEPYLTENVTPSKMKSCNFTSRNWEGVFLFNHPQYESKKKKINPKKLFHQPQPPNFDSIAYQVQTRPKASPLDYIIKSTNTRNPKLWEDFIPWKKRHRGAVKAAGRAEIEGQVLCLEAGILPLQGTPSCR